MAWPGQVTSGDVPSTSSSGASSHSQGVRGKGRAPRVRLANPLRGTHVYKQMSLCFIITSAGTCSHLILD